MKLYLLIAWLLIFASLAFGQTPSVSSVQPASPEKAKTFGSSLEKYKDKKPPEFQGNKKSAEPDDVETIRVKTDLVVNDVLVTDQNGKIITGLIKDDFIVAEDNVLQKIELFSSDETTSNPRSIVLIIDYFALQAPYLKNSIQAAKLLVDKLNPNDKMAIVTVDVKLRMDFTSDKDLLKKTLDSLENIATNDFENLKRGSSGSARVFLNSLKIKKGMTFGIGEEFESLLAVLNEMFDEKNRQRIVIFQGDGGEMIWLKPDNDAPYKISQSTRDDSGMRYVGKKAMSNIGFSEVREAIESSRATIYSVVTGIRFLGLSKKEQEARGRIAFENTFKTLGFEGNPAMTRRFEGRDTEIHTAGQTAMLRIAELSGGSLGFIEKPEDAENVYSNIFVNIKNRYAIGYYPTNQAQDGKRRDVKIEVRGHPEYTVSSRRSYFPR